MALTAGIRLGPYEVGEALGKGGMGEVYRARDTRLHRTVAVKVLPAEAMGASPDARARLQREARTLSQLSHPHVCTLHDVGDQDGIDYLVMELVEGDTLADRLLGGPLPYADVLAIGAQIAGAVDAAHRLGIVHRDLKPGNVMLTRAGAKVLDFGLAKPFVRAAPGPGDDQTATAAIATLTTECAVVGTLPYMSPEQLEGRTVDARSDVFAFGAVLFEMATGRRAFAGESGAAVTSSIMSGHPPAVSSLRPDAPAALDGIVRTCLEKDPDRRWQSMRDVAVLLGSAGEAAPATATVPARSTAARAVPWVVAAVAVGAAFATSPLARPTAVTAPGVVSFGLPPPDGHTFFTFVEATEMAVSPDGTRVAFVASNPRGRRSLWIRALADTTATEVPGTDGAVSAFWSPDGRSLGLFDTSALMRVDLDGGPPIRLCALASSVGHGGSWGADGQIVFAAVDGGAIFRTTTAGTAAEVLVEPDATRQEARVRWPHFLPDGRRFLYLVEHEDGTGTLMLWSPGAAPRALMPGASNAAFVEPGFVVFARDGALLARRFDPAAGEVTGEAVAIADRVNYFRMTGVAHYAASPNGVIAYQSDADLAHIAWFDREGRELAVAAGSGGYLSLRLSPDNRELLFDRTEPSTGSYDEWLLDLERGVETRLTTDPGNEIGGAWVPGGSALFFSAGPKGPPTLVYRDPAGAMAPVEVGTGLQTAQDVSPDGAWLAFGERRADGSQALRLLSLASGPPWSATPFLESAFSLGGARFSPDGRWLAFTSNESGRTEVYVSPFPATGRTTRISTSGGRLPHWQRDGRELVYVSADGELMAVPMTAGQPGVPVSLFRMREGAIWADFDVAADGRFIAIVPESFANRRPMTVVVNWPDRIR